MKLFIGIVLVAVVLQPHTAAGDAAAASAAAAGSGGSAAAAAAATAGDNAAAAAAALAASEPAYHCTCPLVYSPVCGTDGRTYSNECVLRCASDDGVRRGRAPVRVHCPGECPLETCLCPYVVQPVCGTDGYTYRNECALVCENRRRARFGLPEIKIANRGRCPPVPCYCSGAVIPVCGTDGVTYRNICFLQCASRRNQGHGLPPIYYKSSGACTKETCYCSKEYRPVCASDGRTYANKCLLDCENRRRNALGKLPLSVRNDGPCYTCDCPGPVDPVCASDERTYRSPCHLQCENDARARIGLPPLKTLYKGVCGCACKKYFDPVCGSDEQTYDNICLLHCESNRRVFLGKSPIVLAYGGPCVCNCRGCHTGYQPWCGSDGRTYWNKCWLNCYSACNQKKGLPKITPVKLGYC